MKIILRKQRINYEPNEYELFGAVSIEIIKEAFKNFPWKEQIDLKDELLGFHISPSFNLIYKNKELTITGYHNGQFSVCYNYTILLKWQFGANMFNQEEVFNLIDQFIILKPKYFIRILSKKRTIEESLLSIISITLTQKNKRVFSQFSSRERNIYKMSFLRMFYFFGFSLVWLLMPLGLLIYFGGDFNNPFIIFQIIFLLIATPAIIISINHFAYNGKLKLIFQKGENKFEVIEGARSIIFDKKDILKIIEIDTNTSRAPWGIYGYYIVQFKNGAELWLSNILIGSKDVYKQFYVVEKECKYISLPLLKKTIVITEEE